jgi:hypothetical protein
MGLYQFKTYWERGVEQIDRLHRWEQDNLHCNRYRNHCLMPHTHYSLAIYY